MILSILLGYIPAFVYAGFVYWLDRYEKEPLPLLGGVFMWGALVAAAGAFLANTLFGVGIFSLTGSESIADFTTSAISAPIIEETLKGLAVLLVFFFARQEFDSILDGVVYAGIAALGFSATENALYIYQYGYSESGVTGALGLTFIRVILVGWQHPFYTAFFGIGLAVARESRSVSTRFLAPLAGWLLAIVTHAGHNTLASLFSGVGSLLGFIIDWSGWLAMFIFILVMIQRESSWQAEYLKEEVELGTLTAQQYRTACSALQRSFAGLGALTSGKYRQTQRFYQTCAELVHKKRELARMGDETGNTTAVTRLRDDLHSLSPFALV